MKFNINLKDNRTKLIIGGGVALAIILSLGIGLGVGLSDSNSNSQEVKIKTPRENLNDKITSFLNIGLNEQANLKTELEKLKVDLDDENANIQDIENSASIKILSHLENQLNVIKARIQDIENKDDITVFDEVSDKLTELKEKKTKLETLLAKGNVGKQFLDGSITRVEIADTAFEELQKETSVYVTELVEYKKSLLRLKTLITPLAEATTTTHIQNIHDSLVSKTIFISKVQEDIKNILITLINKRVKEIKDALRPISFEDKDKYTDLKTSFDQSISNAESLEALSDYINANIEELLKNTANLNTRFTSSEARLNIVGAGIIKKFKDNQGSIATRLDTLTKVATGMVTGGFNAAIFMVLTTRTVDLAALNTGLNLIKGGTITVDKALETLGTLEDDLYNKITSYENVALKSQQVGTALPATTDPKYPSQKALVDYFANKAKILEDFSTQTGIAIFKKNVADLLKIAISPTAVKDNIKSKIDALIALKLTKDATIEAALNAFKTQLDATGADIAAIQTNLGTKIKEYLTVHLNAIKAKVKEIADNEEIEVFDEVALKLLDLQKKQADLEALNTNTVGADILSGRTTIAKIGETKFTTLTKTVAEYKTELGKYKASLLHLKTKFAGVSVGVQTEIQTILDNIDARTTKVSNMLNNMGTLLTSFLNSRRAVLLSLIDSVPAADRNTYTDIKSIIDNAGLERERLQTTLNLIAQDVQLKALLLSSTGDIDLNFKISGTKRENFVLISEFLKNKDSLKTRTALLTAIKVALGESWIAGISGFLPAKGTLFTDIGALEGNQKYVGIAAKLKAVETKVYNEIMKYKSTGDKLPAIKTELDSLASSDPTSQIYINLKGLYDYLINENEVIKDVSTEAGVTKLITNLNRISDLEEFDFLARLVLKPKIEALATNTPTGTTREALLNKGEFDILQETGLYCGGTTEAEARTKLQRFLDDYQVDYPYVVKPHSIKPNSGFKVTFTKYRDQTNVELDCWRVEISPYPTIANSRALTQAIGIQYAKVRSNSNKQFLVDGDAAANNARIIKMGHDTGVYCDIGPRSIGVQAIKALFPGYNVPEGDLYGGTNIKGSFVYIKSGVSATSPDAWCFKLARNN